MTAFEICDIKNFMSRLLGSTLFDNFLLSEATIQTGAAFQIDGALQKGFYPEEQLEELGISQYTHIPFSLIRSSCFNLMKGKNIPLAFRFVFMLSPENQFNTLKQTGSSYRPEDISGMFININFRNGKITCTTGISYNIFSTDKSLEQEWDHLVEKFFKKNQFEIQPAE